MLRFPVLCLVAAALATGPARASSSEPATQAADRLARFGATEIPRDRVFHTVSSHGVAWSRGATWKARFDGDGVAYFPLFGSRAARHEPLRFGPARVAIDGVPLDVPERAEPRRSDDVVTYERGVLVERYELAPDSIEQVFVLSSLPARGEIAVRVPIETGLAGARLADGSLEFAGERGRVRYSRAIAFDAVGRQLALETTATGGGVEITVPAEFVLDAVLPITIDPIVTSVAIDASNVDTVAADVCYDESTARFTVVYVTSSAGSDRDVFLRNFTNAGALIIGEDAFVDASDEDWSHVSIANQDETNSNMIAANANESVAGHLVKVVRYALGLGVVAPIAIPGAQSSVGPMRPRIGGDPTTGAGTRLFCVVWDRRETTSNLNRNVSARCILPTGAAFGTANIPLAIVTGQDDGDPSISRTNDGTSWIVAWERGISATDGDIRAARIAFDGTVAQADYAIEANSVNYRNPEVSSRIAGTNRYVVVMERVFPDGTSDVFANLMNDTTKEDGTTINFIDGTPDFGTGSPADTDPQISCDGRHFAITYVEQASVGSANTNVFVTDWMVTDTELRLAESRRTLASSSTAEARPRSAAVHSGGSATSRRHMIVWDDDDTNVEGAIYDSLEGGAWSGYCFGDGTGTACPCGNTGGAGRGCASSVNASGALLDVDGTVSTTADDAQLRGRFMPPNSTCLYFQGTAEVSSPIPPFLPGAVFGDGLRCTGGTILRLAQVTNSSIGASAFPTSTLFGPDLHVSGAVPAAGSRRTYQAWYRNAAAFCTSSTFNLTNGVIVDWGP